MYNEFLINILILNDENTMSYPIKGNSNTIEPTMHASCYCVLDLLCVKINLLLYLKGGYNLQKYNLKSIFF